MNKVLIFVLLLVARDVWSFKILGSMYADYNEAAGGAGLWKYPLRTRLPYSKKRVSIYPVAVYSDKVKFWKYKVLKIKNPKTKKYVYGHVVDECPYSSSSCSENKWKARRRGMILIDIHQSAWRPLGLKRMDLHKLKGKHVYTISRTNKAMKPVLTTDGEKGYVKSLWK